ncbi:MAG: mechanosensitive ion channel family protein [Pyrinomonadaceae bacterium]|nr:mechanosensitive ion channel family protein [Pyrinomonadaceae bacterium]
MFLQNTNATGKVLENASQVTNVAYSSVNNLVKSVIEQLPYLVSGIIVLLFFWLLSKGFKKLFWVTSNRTKLDNRLRILFSRLIGIFILVLGIFTALTVIVPSFRFGDLIAGLGFTSFIVGFATKDILNNLLSGVLILWKQPFKIGDYIFVKDKQGKVEYIGVRATTLQMDDGERILMPNGEMYSQPLVIRGAGAARRMKLKVSIGYDAEIERAKSKIVSVLDDAKGVVADPKPSVYVTDLASEGVNLSIYFWINTNENNPLAVFDRVATGIKRALSKSDIELYPTSPIIVQEAKVQLLSENGSESENSKDDF